MKYITNTLNRNLCIKMFNSKKMNIDNATKLFKSLDLKSKLKVINSITKFDSNIINVIFASQTIPNDINIMNLLNDLYTSKYNNDPIVANKYMKALLACKCINEEFYFTTCSNRCSNWNEFYSRLSLNELDMSTKSVLAHESGHAMFDILMKTAIPTNFESITSNSFANFQNMQLLRTLENGVRGFIKDKIRKIFMDRYKTNNYGDARQLYIREKVNEFKNLSISQILDILDSKQIPRDNYSILSSLETFAEEMFKAESNNLYNNILDNSFNSLGCITDIISAISKGKIMEFACHDAEYYLRDVTNPMHEMIADFIEIKMSNDKLNYSILTDYKYINACDFLKSIIGDECYNMLDTVYEKIMSYMDQTLNANSTKPIYDIPSRAIEYIKSNNANELSKLTLSEKEALEIINKAISLGKIDIIKQASVNNLTIAKSLMKNYNIFDFLNNPSISLKVLKCSLEFAKKNNLLNKIVNIPFDIGNNASLASCLLSYGIEFKFNDNIDVKKEIIKDIIDNIMVCSSDFEVVYAAHKLLQDIGLDYPKYKVTNADYAINLIKNGYYNINIDNSIINSVTNGLIELMNNNSFNYSCQIIDLLLISNNPNIFVNLIKTNSLNNPGIILELFSKLSNSNTNNIMSAKDIIILMSRIINNVNYSTPALNMLFNSNSINLISNLINSNYLNLDVISKLYLKLTNQNIKINESDRLSLIEQIKNKYHEELGITEIFPDISSNHAMINQINYNINQNGYAFVNLNSTTELNVADLKQISDLSKVKFFVKEIISDSSGNIKGKYNSQKYISRHTYTGTEYIAILSRIEYFQSKVDMSLPIEQRARQIYNLLASECNVMKDYNSTPEKLLVSQSLRGLTQTNILGESGLVCAGYASVFKVLCDRCNIPCDYVKGTGILDPLRAGGKGPHAWNVITDEYGNNIPIDVTWKASNGKEEWFGATQRFLESHIIGPGEIQYNFNIIKDTSKLTNTDILNKVVYTMDCKYGAGRGIKALENYINSGDPMCITRTDNVRNIFVDANISYNEILNYINQFKYQRS